MWKSSDRDASASDHAARWHRLTRLLEPIHAQAVATARRLCRSRDEGDDLYQEAVLRAFDKLHGLRDESRFRAWFFATLLSRHRSRRRRSPGREVPIEEAFEPGREPMSEDGTSWEGERRRAERVMRALASLASVQREAIVLHELEGFSIEEIAEVQRVSVSAVKSRLQRGRDRLRRFYMNVVSETGIPPRIEPLRPAPEIPKERGGAPPAPPGRLAAEAVTGTGRGGIHE